MPVYTSLCLTALNAFTEGDRHDHSNDKEEKRHDQVIKMELPPGVIEMHLHITEESPAGGFGKVNEYITSADDP